MGAYMGVGYSGYEYETCPLCGQGMWRNVERAVRESRLRVSL